MKRVLIFSIAYHPFIGGAEIAVKEITDRLSPEEFEFDMITVNLNGREKPVEKIGTVTVYRLGSGVVGKFLLPITGTYKAWNLSRKKAYDCIWSIMANQASIAAVFFSYLKPGTKLVLTVQEGDEEEYLKRYVFGNNFLYNILIRPWHRLAFHAADAVTSISTYLADRARASGAKAPITIVPNGVDIELFTRQIFEEEKRAMERTIGKKDGDVVIITTSRLVAKNAIADIIAALKRLPDHFKLLILGVGPLEAALKKQTHDLGLEARVQFIGYVEHKDIPAYLAVSDIFVRPSLSEGMGNSFIEAMAAGVPVVATPVGGIPDFLKDKETGLFARVHDPDDIAAKIQALVEYPDLRNSVIANARKLVVERYGWDRIAREMKALF